MLNQNIFSNPFLKDQTDVNDIYRKIDALKIQQAQQTNARNAYDDLRSLYKDMSADERRYIESSDEFIKANMEYQEAFGNFMIDRMGSDFLQSQYGSTVEKTIAVIKRKKEEYHDHLAEDINTIKEQNASLMSKNDELAKTNKEMTELIKSLQDQLWVKK